MSHELRTPLNAILGFSEVIREGMFGPVDQRYRDYAGDIHASGRHLLALVNDLLDIARIDAGRLTIDPGALDALDMVRSVVSLVEVAAATNRVVLEVDAVACWVDADARALKQILVNLLTNAVKFTPPGGRVTMRLQPTEANIVWFEVADTGIGMTAEEAETFRRPFMRGDSALVRNREGVGLGLPITDALVKAHGATLDIISTPGEGTRMRFALPRAVPRA
jgi:signal transduction histidine kinase